MNGALRHMIAEALKPPQPIIGPMHRDAERWRAFAASLIRFFEIDTPEGFERHVGSGIELPSLEMLDFKTSDQEAA